MKAAFRVCAIVLLSAALFTLIGCVIPPAPLDGGYSGHGGYDYCDHGSSPYDGGHLDYDHHGASYYDSGHRGYDSQGSSQYYEGDNHDSDHRDDGYLD